MKKLTLLTVLFLVIHLCKAQTPQSTAAVKDTVATTAAAMGDDEIRITAETPADYPGGLVLFLRFFGTWVRYPREDQMARISGKVFASFVIEKDGSLSQITILKGVSPTIDKETIRVIKMSPKWIPAKDKGLIVRQKITLPFTFNTSTEYVH